MPSKPLQIVCGYLCAVAYKNVLDSKRIAKEHKVIKETLKAEVYSNKYKKILQMEVNKLSRIIDKKFGYIYCIDCGKPFGKQTDAAHFHSRGANHSLSYNLHNLHSAKSDCNKYSDTHHSGYEVGLKKRYGEEYFNYVNVDIVLKYKHIKLTPNEVVEKLTIVRKLIRDFDTFQFTSAINARNILNELIGIYEN